MKIFASSFIISFIALVVAYFYRGWDAVAVTLILGVLETALSFDNAIVNASILNKMHPFWQKIFLTVGIVIAAFGMRLLFPLLIVWIAAGINPVDGLALALHPPATGQTYESIVTSVHGEIAAFGGSFLLLFFLSFITAEKKITWLTWIEEPLIKAGRLKAINGVITLVALLIAVAKFAPSEHQYDILVAGICGVIVYALIDSLGAAVGPVEAEIEADEQTPKREIRSAKNATKSSFSAGLVMFLYLELIDSSFSFDGVISAFAITNDPIIMTLGLGFIGAIFVRSLTVFLTQNNTLQEFRYLEHGAHWAIGMLAVILLITIGHIEVPDVLVGGISVAIIFLSLVSSIVINRKQRAHTRSNAIKSIS